MAEKGNYLTVEQMAYTKILGHSATDIKHDLAKVSETSALSYPTV
jgi:hypothetical protein